MDTQKIFSYKENTESQFNSEIFPKELAKLQECSFCPTSGRSDSLSFIIDGLCEDCFNND